MTKKIQINWNGVNKYGEENSDKIPQKGGVYEILEQNINTRKYIRRYVGQSENLNQRYLEHLSDNEENENIYDGVRKYPCGFDYALIESEDDRKDAELGLYEKYKYDWNEKEPEGSGYYSDIVITETNNNT